MPMTWEDICSKLRATFGTMISEENYGRFLVNLRPIYRAALDGVRFSEADDTHPTPYCRTLSMLLNHNIIAITMVSHTNPSGRPDFWNEGVGVGAFTRRDHKATHDIMHYYFDIELLNTRAFPIAFETEKRDGVAASRSLDRMIESFVLEALDEPFASLPFYQSQAITSVMRAHLWASVANKEMALADLEPLLPYLITTPPIGRPKIEPNTCLVLVR